MANTVRVDTDEGFHLAATAKRHAPSDVTIVVADAGFVAALARRRVTTAAVGIAAATSATTATRI